MAPTPVSHFIGGIAMCLWWNFALSRAAPPGIHLSSSTAPRRLQELASQAASELKIESDFQLQKAAR